MVSTMELGQVLASLHGVRAWGIFAGERALRAFWAKGDQAMGRMSLTIIRAAVAAILLACSVPAAVGQSDQSPAKPVTSGTEVQAKKLIGSTLKAPDGSALGQVADLIVNPQTGQVEFAIVGIKAGQGVEALAPIPWQALKLESERSFSATIDKQKLQTAPKLSEQQWKQLMQPDYTGEIYKFYGVPEEGLGGPGETPGGAQSGSGQSDQAVKPGSPPRKKL